MTNGLGRDAGGILENPLPKDRSPSELQGQPLYWALCNHIVDFVVSRSKNFAINARSDDPCNVRADHRFDTGRR